MRDAGGSSADAKSELKRSVRQIGQLAIDESRGRCELVVLTKRRPTYVNHFCAERHEHIGNNSPVAAPPQKLGAHDRGAHSARQNKKLFQTFGEFFGARVIGITAKRRVRPGSIERIRKSIASSAERFKPFVRDAVFRQTGLELFRTELRKATRAGKPSDVGNQLDVISLERRNKFVERAC